MINQNDILVEHFKIVGDTLIRVNQRWLEELLMLRHAQTAQIKYEQAVKVEINQVHYLLLQKYSIDSINTLFN
jgi:hypothetical protein